MKFCVSILILLAAPWSLVAQEPPLPSATETPAPSPSARPELNIPDIPIEVEPSPLVPNMSPAPKKTIPTIQELDSAFQHSSLGAAVEEQRLHLEWRKLQNRVSDDPEVVAAKKEIHRARTDVEKRDLMRAYYKVFYAHMQALAETPEIKAYLEQKKNAAIGGLAQPHIRPEPTPGPSSKR
jgi:regulator of replication initiation timing